MSNLNLQWALNESSDRAVALIKDFIRAATTDDVQASAIIAGERFGNTIAISSVTRKKIESAINAQADVLAMKFLKAKIGYSSGGALHVLGRTMAGVNFLALAAALQGTTENFEAATALEMMIESSVPDKSEVLPTAHQLKSLLDVLEPKLLRTGFLEEILGWRNWWIKNESISQASRANLLKNGTAFPSAQGLQHIVEAFRKVSRVGEADTRAVNIIVSSCAPWVTAFTKWSLGIPPKILIQDGGIILDQPDSPVTLVYTEYHGKIDEVRIEVLRVGESLSELLEANISSLAGGLGATGMVSVTTHAHESLQQLDFERGSEETASIGYRALLEALPFALDQVRRSCYLPSQSLAVAICSFPNAKRIADVAKRYLGLGDRFELKQLSSGSLIADIGLVRTWAETQKSFLEANPQDLFQTRAARIVADILALSLFGRCLDGIMLRYGPDRTYRGAQRDWLDVTRDILITGNCQPCPIETILDWALGLVHHRVSQELRDSRWIGSSFKGQVVFPMLFEFPELLEDGYLGLYCLPGVLMADGARNKRFHLVTAKSGRRVRSAHSFLNDPVTHAVNLFPTEKILWQTDTLADSLDVALGWTGNVDMLNPYHVLQVLARAVLLGTCSHGAENVVLYPPTDAYLQGPADDQLTAYEPSRRNKIVVFPVRGNMELRLLALSSIAWRLKENTDKKFLVLISNSACIDCSLHYCRILDCQYLLF
jgi:hypothetical protein